MSAQPPVGDIAGVWKDKVKTCKVLERRTWDIGTATVVAVVSTFVLVARNVLSPHDVQSCFWLHHSRLVIDRNSLTC